jgi:hypothetical protein
MRDTSITFRLGRKTAGIITAGLILFGAGVSLFSIRTESGFVISAHLDFISAQLSLTSKTIERLYQAAPRLTDSEIKRTADLELGGLGAKLNAGELIFIEDIQNPRARYIKTDRFVKTADNEALKAIPDIEGENYFETADGKFYRFISSFDKNGGGKAALIYTAARSDISRGAEEFDNGFLEFPLFFHIFLYILLTAAGSAAISGYILKLLKPAQDVHNALNRIVMGDFAFKLPDGEELISSYNGMVERLNQSKQSLSSGTALEKRAEEELRKYRVQLDHKLLESGKRGDETIRKLTKEVEETAAALEYFEDAVRKNIFATVASATGHTFFRWWEAGLGELKISVIQAERNADKSVCDALTAKMASMSAEAKELEETLIGKDQAELFSVLSFYEKCKRIVKIFEKDGISFTVNLSGGEESHFLGYEHFYVRTFLFFSGYVAYNVLIRKTENPDITVQIGAVPGVLRITIMDNCGQSGELGSVTDIYTIDKQALLIHYYIDLLAAYGGELNITRIGRGHCYLFEFKSLGADYES